MLRSPALHGLALLGVLHAVAALADPGSFLRFPGGGPAGTDCMLVTDVAGVVPSARARTAVCTDGDPACDGDGLVNGTCVLTVRLCLDDASQPDCRPEPVSHVAVRAAGGALRALTAAVEGMPMPVIAPDICTAPAAVPVPTHGRWPGRVVLRAAATMSSGHADRDRIVLTCRRPGAPATFATIVRTIFARGCTSASCHGAAGAGGLALTGDAAYTNLVGVPPANPAARDAGLLRVAPGDPGRSFLLQKLAGTLGPGEGSPMPFVGNTLGADRQALIRRWIIAGAPADAPF